MSSFYIGYLPKAPDDLARFLRRVVRLLIPGAMIVAALLIVAQQRFSPAFFEWQQEREFSGVVEEHPYPTLLVRRPGAHAGFSRYLLVGVGKSSAGRDVAGLDGRPIDLRGKLIYRAEITAIEVMPGSVKSKGSRGATQAVEPGGIVQVKGEIVDSKCYGGVMNPGQGKVHRDCAVRCLSGGIPPVLVGTTDSGEISLYELADRDGSPLPMARFLSRVAEPVTITGRLLLRGDTKMIAVQSID